ncbi:hypothetical protein BKA69DRAFT_172110 [Paraphysoderma sedebokerense]|nr:hypothetical protein BKA69DRAFT_172110 [Paraphysoderma sedebokerense]
MNPFVHLSQLPLPRHHPPPPVAAPPAERYHRQYSNHLAMPTSVPKISNPHPFFQNGKWELPKVAQPAQTFPPAASESPSAIKPFMGATGHLTDPASLLDTELLTEKKLQPKRPMNAFIIYRREKQRLLLNNYSGISNNDISKIVAEMWKNEPEEVKSYFKQIANKVKEEHKKRYPDYKYQPRKNKKNLKPNAGMDILYLASNMQSASSGPKSPQADSTDAAEIQSPQLNQVPDGTKTLPSFQTLLNGSLPSKSTPPIAKTSTGGASFGGLTTPASPEKKLQ